MRSDPDGRKTKHVVLVEAVPTSPLSIFSDVSLEREMDDNLVHKRRGEKNDPKVALTHSLTWAPKKSTDISFYR